MRIAFDVMGTIDGPAKKEVLKLFFALQALGHEMVVWSSEYGLAVRANESNRLNAKVMSKREKYSTSDTDDYMDLAIDDDTRQTYLATHKFLYVHELPRAEGIDALAQAITEGKEPKDREPRKDDDYFLP